MGMVSLQEHILTHPWTHHTRKLVVYLHRLYLYVFQFPEGPSVSEVCTFLNFNLVLSLS
jgi:hypothetical protein